MGVSHMSQTRAASVCGLPALCASLHGGREVWPAALTALTVWVFVWMWYSNYVRQQLLGGLAFALASVCVGVFMCRRSISYYILIIPAAHLGHSAVVWVPTGEAGGEGVPVIIYRSEVTASALSAAAAAPLLSEVALWTGRWRRGGAGSDRGIYSQEAYVHCTSMVAEGSCGGACVGQDSVSGRIT